MPSKQVTDTTKQDEDEICASIYSYIKSEGISLTAQRRQIPSVIVRLHARDQTGANSLNKYFRTN